jgi:hypothetical protein
VKTAVEEAVESGIVFSFAAFTIDIRPQCGLRAALQASSCRNPGSPARTYCR